MWPDDKRQMTSLNGNDDAAGRFHIRELTICLELAQNGFWASFTRKMLDFSLENSMHFVVSREQNKIWKKSNLIAH